MTYSINAHELRAQAILQAIKDISAWTKQTVSMIKSHMQGSTSLSHTA